MTDGLHRDSRMALLAEQFGVPTPEYKPTVRERDIAHDRVLWLQELTAEAQQS